MSQAPGWRPEGRLVSVMEQRPARRNRWLARLGAAAAGGMLTLAFAPTGLWWLAWFGLAPVVVLVAEARSRGEAALRGWIAGTAFFVALHYWLIPSLGLFVVPIGPVVGLAWIPWALVAHGLLDRRRSPLMTATAVLVVPAVWMVTEALRSWKHLGGTWGLLGLTQWNNSPILQGAALGGVWLLSLLLVAFNVGLAAAFLQKRWAHRTLALGLAAALPIVSLAYGLWRAEPPVTRVLHVAGIQPGVVHGGEDRLDAHERLTRQLSRTADEYDLVVWGQSSVGFDPESNPDVERRLRETAAAAGADLFVNVDARDDEGRITKSMRQYTPGGVQAVYEKSRLVPFGEYVPLRGVFGWITRFSEAAQEDRVPGTHPTVMRSAGAVIGPLVSYESTFPDLRRTVVRLSPAPDLTLVQAASTTFQGSWAQPQQASFEAVRAVESGRPAVLVAVSGTSAAFDGRGERLAWVPSDRSTAFVVDVPLSREATPYVRWGDWVLWGSWATLAVTVFVGLARRRRPGPAGLANGC